MVLAQASREALCRTYPRSIDQQAWPRARKVEGVSASRPWARCDTASRRTRLDLLFARVIFDTQALNAQPRLPRRLFRGIDWRARYPTIVVRHHDDADASFLDDLHA